MHQDDSDLLQDCLAFRRRDSGCFDVCCLDEKRISADVSSKKLTLVEKRKTYLTEYRKEAALHPAAEAAGFRADFL